jgi:hypothetical protein
MEDKIAGFKIKSITPKDPFTIGTDPSCRLIFYDDEDISSR